MTREQPDDPERPRAAGGGRLAGHGETPRCIGTKLGDSPETANEAGSRPGEAASSRAGGLA